MQIIKQDVGIGRNIRKLRKNKKLTQPQVVAQMQILGCAISVSSYIKIEGEYHTIKVSDLVALQHIFGCSFEDFFEGLKL